MTDGHEGIKYSVNVEYDAEENEYVATMEGFWFVEAGRSEHDAIDKLAASLLDFSRDCLKDSKICSDEQFRYAKKALAVGDEDSIKELFDVMRTDETRIVEERIKRIERHPESTVAWADIRREEAIDAYMEQVAIERMDDEVFIPLSELDDEDFDFDVDEIFDGLDEIDIEDK